ncbi:unnamed protein product, partial [Porites evermanni]
MATTSPSFCETSAFKKNSVEKRKNKGSEAKEEILKSKSKSNSKVLKVRKNSSTELLSSKSLATSIQEPVWDTEYSEELNVPVPDLYPELSESLQNMQDSDTEQEEIAKVRKPACDKEDIQCVPTSCNDSRDDPVASQSQDDSQLSNTGSQAKQKRKLAKPRKVRKRKGIDQGQNTITLKENSELLADLQGTDKQGTWAQCSIPSCGKWRFLQSNVDPNELPERWVCAMNENEKYNECSASQETFDSQEGNLDVMYTPYPSGAIVWAKMVGYPWWPAMMEDDPDYGYYCETGEDNVTPEMYHVVFFDKEVSRTWVNAVCIRNFSCDDDPEDMGKVTFKGKNYRRQLTAVTLAARRAAQLPLQRRLAEYGFAARYKGPIGRKAVEESKRSISLETGELSDSVTDSSSQDFSSSGNSFISENSYSSPDEPKRLKPKTPLKSKTRKEKTAKTPIKSEKKKMQQTKPADSAGRKEKAGKKEAKKATADASITPYGSKAPQSSSTSTNIEMQMDTEQPTEGDQGKNKNTEMVLSNHCEAPVPNTLNSKIYSEDTICENERSMTKPSAKKLVESNSLEVKVVKKRKKSDEVRGRKNAKKSKEDNSNVSLLENSAKIKQHEKADANVMSLNTLLKTQKKRTACEEKEAVSKTKERERPTEDRTKAEGPCPESGGNGVDKEKDSGSHKKRTNKNEKRKTAGSFKKGNEGRESGKGSEELTPSSEGTGKKEPPGDGLHPENHPQPQNSGFTLKRSSANTDVRVSLTEKVTQKKPLPKLVKAFKPPIAKEGKGPKMPKLLKPQFVSPALAVKKGDKNDLRKEGSEPKAESNTETKPLGTTKGMKLKSKSPQTMVHSQSEKSKESEPNVNLYHLTKFLIYFISFTVNFITFHSKTTRKSDAGELEDIDDRLQKDGYRTNIPVEHKLRYFWRQFTRSEASLKSSLESVEQLRKQHGEEMIEVENYVAHIRQLSDEREALTQDLEAENEQLKAELEQMKVEKEAGAYISEDICDMLIESGLTQIGRDTNPVKEQVNYLIKERTSLSEKVRRLELDNENLKKNSDTEQSNQRMMKIMEEERKDMEDEMNRMREMMKQVKQEERKIHEQEMKKVTEENDGLRSELQKAQKQHNADMTELINRHQGMF